MQPSLWPGSGVTCTREWRLGPPQVWVRTLELALARHPSYKRALLGTRLRAWEVRNHKFISDLSVINQETLSQISWAPAVCSKWPFRENLKTRGLVGRGLLARNWGLTVSPFLIKFETPLETCRNKPLNPSLPRAVYHYMPFTLLKKLWLCQQSSSVQAKFIFMWNRNQENTKIILSKISKLK